MRITLLSLLCALGASACTIHTVGGAPMYAGADPCGLVCGAPAQCRAAVHRLYNPGSGEHFYTTTVGEGTDLGFNVEGANYFYFNARPLPGLLPLNRCLMDYGKHFYTTQPNCEGVTPGHQEGVLGYLSPTPQCGMVALHRGYNARSNDHFYTIDAAEHAAAVSNGYTDEGITGYVYAGLAP